MAILSANGPNIIIPKGIIEVAIMLWTPKTRPRGLFHLLLQKNRARRTEEGDRHSDDGHEEEIDPKIWDDPHPEGAQPHDGDGEDDGMDPVLETAPGCDPQTARHHPDLKK